MVDPVEVIRIIDFALATLWTEAAGSNFIQPDRLHPTALGGWNYGRLPTGSVNEVI